MFLGISIGIKMECDKCFSTTVWYFEQNKEEIIYKCTTCKWLMTIRKMKWKEVQEDDSV